VTLIGLKRNAQIVVPEEHVNRSHAAIINTGAHVLLVDLFTDAGTYCNGRLISKELLTDGDVVRVGSTDLRFSIEMPPNPVVPRRGILSFDDPLKMPKALRLIQVETDEGWEIVDSTAIIGNCNQAEVRIHDEGIAPAHSLIFGTINGIGIMDLGSSTPLKINGNEKQMAYLRRQDRLLIGRTGLMIQFPKERGAAQGGSAGILSSTTPADESSGDWAGQFHGQTDAGSLTGRDTSRNSLWSTTT
jgi:pSer/pThr/pTyr-binding forkhead associated (FHA) protein